MSHTRKQVVVYTRRGVGRQKGPALASLESLLSEAWDAFAQGEWLRAIELCERARAGNDVDLAFEAAVIEADALRNVARADEALQLLLKARDANHDHPSRFGPATALIASTLIASFRLQRGQPDDALMMIGALSHYLESQTGQDDWVLGRASELCWLLGTYRYYAEALALSHAISDRLTEESSDAGRRSIAQSRLMGIIALRSATQGGDDERMARAVDSLVSQGAIALSVLAGWRAQLEAMLDAQHPDAAPQVITAGALEALTINSLGDRPRAIAVLDQVVARFQSDRSEPVRTARHNAALVRNYLVSDSSEREDTS